MPTRSLRIAAAAALLCTLPAAAQRTAFDLLIRNGTIADGSGGPLSKGDVGISGDRIAAIGALPGATATAIIDATGFVVAPGFIDVHTHADDVAERPLAENFLKMGVTSIVAGNCGGSAEDIAQALDRIRNAGISINYATLIGHNTVRRAVMGTERRAPGPAELLKMKGLVWKAMSDGAVGFSTGLQYVPGTYADAVEIVTLAKVAAEAGGVYASHIRNEGTQIEEALEEAIHVGEVAACPVEISHLKIDSPKRWGASSRALAIIDAARSRGVDVRADQYVYTAASSGLGIRFPSWVLEGGPEAIARRLNDAATWKKIRTEMTALLEERGLDDLSFAVVASYARDPSLNGLAMDKVAMRLKGAATLDAQLETAREMMLAGGAAMVYHFMSEDDIAAIMRHPMVAFASDSSVLAGGDGVPHPRGYGNNARVLGRYVRELRVMTLPEAIRRMTSLPATQFRFADRGLIKPGYAADLTIFDPVTVTDRATYEAPHQSPAGIPDVIVNGRLTISDGRHTGARSGVVLKATPPRR